MKEQLTSKTNDFTTRLFAYGELKSGNSNFAVVTSKEISQQLGITERQVALLVTRLHTENRIQQLQRGVYLLPARIQAGKLWKPFAYEVLACYMDFIKATWQITGLDAFNRYGFSTQIAQQISVYNNKLSGNKTVAGSNFTFIKLPNSMLDFTNEIKVFGDLKIIYSSKVRTVFDAIYDGNRFNTYSNAYVWLVKLIQEKKAVDELIECCLKCANKKTAARIGFILEKNGVDATKIYAHFFSKQSTTIITLVPGNREGPINKRWHIIENISLNDMFSEQEILDED